MIWKGAYLPSLLFIFFWLCNMSLQRRTGEGAMDIAPPRRRIPEPVTLDLELVSLFFDIVCFATSSGVALAHSPLHDPLEQLRMALTNVPFDPSRVASAWGAVSPLLISMDNAHQDDDTKRSAIASFQSRIQSVISQTDKLDGQSAPPPDASIPAYKLKSCYVQQEMHKILPHLFVGSYHPAASRAVMDAQGITHVCCCINVSPRFPDAYKYLVLPADDNTDYDMSQHFQVSFRFIEEAISSGGNVLVHCGAGISRAPTIVASYLIQKLGLTSEEAIRLIKSVRSCASPNRGFVKHLKVLAGELSMEDSRHPSLTTQTALLM
jgi:hypothetical protein